MSICFNCGDEGVDGGCKSCHKDSSKLIVKKEDKESFIKKSSFSQIPNNYVGVMWSKQILLDNHPEMDNNIKFKNACNRLEVMHEKFKDGMIPNLSVFISGPSKMGKTILAYSCMQHAIRNNVKVSPFIDTVELKRLLTLGGDNPNWKLYGYINYDSYITCPVCFITVTKLDKHRESYTIISELIARRSRLGFPTFVLSKFSLKEISVHCIDSDYTKIMDYSGKDDFLKYPTIIEF
ncbi:MAG: hypothetical protein ACRC5M_07280 [Anaeroplasmataceae bacterium]